MNRSISILLDLRRQSAYQNALKNFFSSSPTSHSLPNLRNRRNPDSLYRRISPVGDPDISIVPVLDQWVQEGRKVEQWELHRIVTELKQYKRYKHALEISQWMTDRMYIPPSSNGMATRLSLIYEVHGLGRVEEYYNNITRKMKSFQVYIALLNCYANAKSVEKAEGIMQELRDMGHIRSALPYNILLNLYYNVRDWEKLETLVREMEEKGIPEDKYTLSTRMNTYAASFNSEGMDMLMKRVESDPQIATDCPTYLIASNAYFSVGLVDKAYEILKKTEELMGASKRKVKIFSNLLVLYGKLGKKDDLYRIWNLFKEEKLVNRSYMVMISSLLKIGDTEGAEKILEEWESTGLSYDFRVPDFLIDFYVKNGNLEKAEALLNRGMKKGGSPFFQTWYYLAKGYIEDNQVLNAVDALKKALTCRCAPYQNPIKDKIVICLEYLDGQRDMEEAEECIKVLKEEGIFSETACERLLSFIKDENLKS